MTRATLTFVLILALLRPANAKTYPPNVSFQHFTIPAGNGPCAVVAADFNRDGNMDVAFVNGTDNSVATHAEVPYSVKDKIGFWNDRVAQQDLGNFVKSIGETNSCLPSY